MDENKEGSTKSISGNIGCAFIIIAAGIFFSFPRVLDLIELAIKCHK